MKGFVVALAIVASAGGVQAAGKKQVDCGHQAAVVAAIQQARLDRVAERKVQAHVTENATWPEKYNATVPLLTPWVYEMKMRDVKAQNLAEAWNEMCLLQ